MHYRLYTVMQRHATGEQKKQVVNLTNVYFFFFLSCHTLFVSSVSFFSSQMQHRFTSTCQPRTGAAFSLWGQTWLVASCLHMLWGMKVPQECHTRGFFTLWLTVLDSIFSLHCYCITRSAFMYTSSVHVPCLRIQTLHVFSQRQLSKIHLFPPQHNR